MWRNEPGITGIEKKERKRPKGRRNKTGRKEK